MRPYTPGRSDTTRKRPRVIEVLPSGELVVDRQRARRARGTSLAPLGLLVLPLLWIITGFAVLTLFGPAARRRTVGK